MFRFKNKKTCCLSDNIGFPPSTCMHVLAGASSSKPVVVTDNQETQPMNVPEEIAAAVALHRWESKSVQELDSQELDHDEIPPSQVAEPPTPPKRSKKVRWFDS